MGDMEGPHVTFRIRFTSSEPDVLVSVESTASFRLVIAQIREVKGWKLTKNIRLICQGREVFPGEPVSTAPGDIVHCIATEYVPPPQVPRKPAQVQVHQPAVEEPPLDWLDIVDPGTVLMWIFGCILALLWVLFIFYAHMFDKTSVVMLCMMTFAFLIPCALSYMPGLSFLNTYSYTPAQHQHRPPDQASAQSTAVPPRMAQQRHLQQRAGIPPRPPALVQPGA